MKTKDCEECRGTGQTRKSYPSKWGVCIRRCHKCNGTGKEESESLEELVEQTSRIRSLEEELRKLKEFRAALDAALPIKEPTND